MGKRRETKIAGVEKIEEGVYRVRGKYIEPNTGRRRELDRYITAASAPEAAAERLRLLEEKAGSRAAVDPEYRPRFDEMMSKWFEAKSLTISESTKPKYRTAVDVWTAARSGEMVLGDFFADMVVPEIITSVMLQWREEGYKTSTINTRLGSLRTFATDMRVRHIVDGVRQLKPTVEEVEEERRMAKAGGRGLNVEEVRRVLNVGPVAPLLVTTRSGRTRTKVPTDWHANWTLAATLLWCGFRFSEGSGLKWPDIDFESAEIGIMRRQWRGTVRTPKTRAGLRSVPLIQDLIDLLKAHRERMRALGFDVETGPVFPSRKKGKTWISHQTARRTMQIVYAAAEIDLRGRPTVHATRHTLNNLVRQSATEEVRRAVLGGAAGRDKFGPGTEWAHAVAESIRARLMGHANEVRTYTHVTPEESAAALESVAALLSGDESEAAE